MQTKDTTITYLEMTSNPNLIVPPPPSENVFIKKWESPMALEYLEHYSSVGKEYYWVDRLLLDTNTLQAILDQPTREIYCLYSNNLFVGFSELNKAKDNEIKIEYFGILNNFIGKGYGKYLLHWTIHFAWKQKINRLWVSTCNLDHPNALTNYEKCGFQSYKTEDHKQQIK